MNLEKGIVAALTQEAGFTMDVAVQKHGFIENGRVINHFMDEFKVVIADSKVAMKTIASANTVNEVVKGIKKQTLTSLTNKAVTALKQRLESGAYMAVGVVKDSEMSLFAGNLVVDVDRCSESDMSLRMSYGYAVLVDLIGSHVAQVQGVNDVHSCRAIANKVLKNNVINEMLVAFNESFCTALATGDYKLGFGSKYYYFTKEEGEQHKEALFVTMSACELVKTYEDILNESIASMLKQAAESKEKPVKEVVQEVVEAEEETVVTKEETIVAEEMITVTVAEYDLLKSIAVVAEQNKKATDELIAKNTEFANLVVGLEQELTIKDKLVAKRDEEIADLTKELAQQKLNVEKLTAALQKQKTQAKAKEEVTMTEFKLNIKSFNEVEVRKAKEGKATVKDLNSKDVGAIVKATVKTVSATKGLNNKIREKAPEVIVKAANATHTGIDKVAIVAHKTTNVIAKSTNTVIAKSANAVDAMLDVVAPTKHTVNISAIKRIKDEAKEGDVYEIDGYSYQVVNGKHIVL